jgi:hypothetical protein
VPRIIDYPIVLQTLAEQKLQCVYPNSGAFAFDDGVAKRTLGWIGPADESIREHVRHLVRAVPSPFEENLTRLLTDAWRKILLGKIWLMPASHWAYELDFASRDWLPQLLQSVRIEPALLQSRTNAAAIEFAEDESELAERFVLGLLRMLQASDFTIAFPRRAVTCLLHHHRQLWWSGSDEIAMSRLEALA